MGTCQAAGAWPLATRPWRSTTRLCARDGKPQWSACVKSSRSATVPGCSGSAVVPVRPVRSQSVRHSDSLHWSKGASSCAASTPVAKASSGSKLPTGQNGSCTLSLATPVVTLLCGRYEGVDERVLDAHGLEEVSLGDFVLSGGELAALGLIDAVVRLLPGVMGNTETAGEESFERGLLEYPHYTRPAVWTDGQGVERGVPEVLLSGHHGKVQAWRLAEAERITEARRPDLWSLYEAGRRAKGASDTNKGRRQVRRRDPKPE